MLDDAASSEAPPIPDPARSAGITAGPDSPSRQPPAQLLPRRCQPALDRADRAAQLLGGHLVSLAFEITQHHGGAKPSGQSADFFVQNGIGFLAELAASVRFFLIVSGHFSEPLLVAFPSCGTGPGIGRNSQRDAVQPRGERVAAADRARPGRQHQKGGLKRVVGLVAILQCRAADPHHHFSMPRQERGKRELGRGVIGIAPGGKSLEQLAVVQPGHGATLQQLNEVSRRAGRISTGHSECLTGLSNGMCAHYPQSSFTRMRRRSIFV